MIIQIIPKIGGAPIAVEAAQFAVFNEAGTLIAVAGEYGPKGTIRISHAGEDPNEFESTKRAFGYGQHEVVVDHLSSPPPPSGARLIGGPGFKKP